MNYLCKKEHIGSVSAGKTADKTTDCLVWSDHPRFAPECSPSSRDFPTLHSHEVERKQFRYQLHKMAAWKKDEDKYSLELGHSLPWPKRRVKTLSTLFGTCTWKPLRLQTSCSVHLRERVFEFRIMRACQPSLVEVVANRNHEVDSQVLPYSTHLQTKTKSMKLSSRLHHYREFCSGKKITENPRVQRQHCLRDTSFWGANFEGP